MIYTTFKDFIMDNIIWLSIVLGFVLLVLIILIIMLIKKHNLHKLPKIKIDEEYVKELVDGFGSKSNINTINVDGNKLKVNVIDLDKVDLDKIKTMANSGVFVTNNDIKTLFKYDSEILRKELNKYNG